MDEKGISPVEAVSYVEGFGEDEVYVIFTPSGKRGRVKKGMKVLDAARMLKVDLDSVCGGRGICGRCQVEPSFGEFSKFGINAKEKNLTEFGKTEERYKQKFGLKENRRLGCSTRLEGDMVIDVPSSSQMHRQIIRKGSDLRDIRVDTAVQLCYVDVEKPDMDNPTGDLERIKKALASQWKVEVTCTNFSLLSSLQGILRENDFKVTAMIHDDGRGIVELAWLWPRLVKDIYGLAVDLGSTTISAHLTDLSTGKVVSSSGVMNPQIRFGEDLMSRVSYAMMNPDGDKAMTRAVHEALAGLIQDVAVQASVGDIVVSEDLIVEMVLVGNPVMHHLFLGINPERLGVAPFSLSTSDAVRVLARDYGLPVNPAAQIYILPCIAGHVGADAAAVALSETPWLSEDNVLIVDVGTNAELILGNQEQVLACSSPTGPALEGAQISAGQRAAPGAIERVRIDKETLLPRFRVIGVDLWSDEEGFAEAIQTTGVTGICGSGIIEVIAEMFLAKLILPDGIIDGSLAEKCPNLVANERTWDYILQNADEGAGLNEIRVTQNDIRAIQLAKGALYAGARLLMDQMGIDKLDRISLAGAFGSHIDPKYALVLGMVPDCDPEKVTSSGNAAGTGARIALLDRQTRHEIEMQVRKIKKIETAVEPKFQEHFVSAMGIPNATDPYELLRKKVDLPSFSPASGRTTGRQRRRNRENAAKKEV